jgi:hypothetical protein
MSEQPRFSPTVQAVVADCLPTIRRMTEGRYAISIGGSQGKGTWDERSDVDFRLFYDQVFKPEVYQEFAEHEADWRREGVLIDGTWVRKIGDIDAALERWLAGNIVAPDIVWTIWGYRVLPDIYHQAVIEDPYDVIGAWKRRLSAYPAALKQSVLKKHLESVRYWRQDYHYRHKVGRGDIVFLAGLSARLVHDLIEILFALNETYFVGDGQNLQFVEGFALKPEGFADKVRAILYPGTAPESLQAQYDHLGALIDEVVALAERNS